MAPAIGQTSHALRELQAETGGFTEFVPLPFVHMEAPMYRLGMARSGPTFREAVLMHSIGAARPASADIEHPDLLGEVARPAPQSA